MFILLAAVYSNVAVATKLIDNYMLLLLWWINDDDGTNNRYHAMNNIYQVKLDNLLLSVTSERYLLRNYNVYASVVL